MVSLWGVFYKGTNSVYEGLCNILMSKQSQIMLLIKFLQQM